MPRLFVALCLMFLSSSAFSQDRSGNDTASDWIARHYESFGLWDSVCDERMEVNQLKQRCYLRYVEVYSPRPNFLATFAFFFTENGQTIVELGFEKRTRFNENGFRVEKDGQNIWAFNHTCLNTTKCRLTGDEAQNFMAQLSAGDTLVQEFRDRTWKNHVLSWDLTLFAKAAANYQTAASKRLLLK